MDRLQISYLQDIVRLRQVRQYPNCHLVSVLFGFEMSRYTKEPLPFSGLSPPSQVPWEQKPLPQWGGNGVDHKPPPHMSMPPSSQPQLPPPNHGHPGPQSHPGAQMGGYMPQYWYQPETNPSLLT